MKAALRSKGLRLGVWCKLSLKGNKLQSRLVIMSIPPSVCLSNLPLA
jgi:hypothetical protein